MESDKKEEVNSMESKNNECVEYSCNNKSGMNARGICTGGEEMNRVCMDGRCVEMMNDNEFVVVIDFDREVNELNMANIIAELSELSGIELDKLTLATEYSDDGSIVRIFVGMDDKNDAVVLADIVNSCQKRI